MKHPNMREVFPMFQPSSIEAVFVVLMNLIPLNARMIQILSFHTVWVVSRHFLVSSSPARIPCDNNGLTAAGRLLVYRRQAARFIQTTRLNDATQAANLNDRVASYLSSWDFAQSPPTGSLRHQTEVHDRIKMTSVEPFFWWSKFETYGQLTVVIYF